MCAKDNCTVLCMHFGTIISCHIFVLICIFVIEESELQPVYGCPLEDHLRIQEREIAFVIEECVTFLYRKAMDIQVSLSF